MKTVLVTGADGFIGKYLCEELLVSGYEVIPITLENGDVRNPELLNSFSNVNHIFHLAARTFVPESFDKSFDYYDVNIMGTINILEYCRKNKCSLTFLSTYVYGEPKYIPVDENHPILAMSPYHQSKIMCESVCEFYSRQFGVDITILRPFNVYGKGQDSKFLIPKILDQLIDKSVGAITVMDLAPRRDYIYIKDLINAMILTVSNVSSFSIYNVGSGESTSVEEVILAAQKASGITKPYYASNETRRNEVSNCVADISTLITETGFVPQVSLVDGLRLMINK